MAERREHPRYTIWFPVTLDVAQGEVWGVCRDASQKGISLSASAPLGIGTVVTVTFRVTPDDPVQRRVSGRVVRIEPGEAQSNPRAVWPYRIAVEFTESVDDIDLPLRRATGFPPPLS